MASRGTSRKLTSSSALDTFLRVDCKSGKLSIEDARYFFDHMLSLKPSPPISWFNGLLGGLVKGKHYSVAISFYRTLDVSGILGLRSNPFILNTLVNCYGTMKLGNAAFSASAYTCSLCPLAIHKPCAESAANQKVKVFTPTNFPKFVETEPRPVYCYPEEHLCLRCIVEGNDFSYECEGCVFQCYLKCGLLPTITSHEGHLKYELCFSPLQVKLDYICHLCLEKMYSNAW